MKFEIDIFNVKTEVKIEDMFMCHVLLIFQTLVLYIMYLVVCMQEFDKSII
jgi:hypothetical protein